MGLWTKEENNAFYEIYDECGVTNAVGVRKALKTRGFIKTQRQCVTKTILYAKHKQSIHHDNFEWTDERRREFEQALIIYNDRIQQKEHRLELEFDVLADIANEVQPLMFTRSRIRNRIIKVQEYHFEPEYTLLMTILLDIEICKEKLLLFE